MYHAACKVEFQPFTRSYSQLTFFNFYKKAFYKSPTNILHKDKTEHARTIFCVKLSINNHIVGLLNKKHIMRTRLMYHAACKVEFQPFKRLYSQLTFFNFLEKFMYFERDEMIPRRWRCCKCKHPGESPTYVPS